MDFEDVQLVKDEPSVAFLSACQDMDSGVIIVPKRSEVGDICCLTKIQIYGPYREPICKSFSLHKK